MRVFQYLISPLGRILQVGDSAHSFLPTSGNGASQAIEDALSLAAAIKKAGPGNIHKATKVHNLLRFERVSTIQMKGFVRRQDIHHVIGEDGKVRPGLNLDAALVNGKWLYTHNPATYATDNYDAALSHLENGTPFENTNLPPGFKYKPWTVKEQLIKEEDGVLVEMGGDWS